MSPRGLSDDFGRILGLILTTEWSTDFLFHAGLIAILIAGRQYCIFRIRLRALILGEYLKNIDALGVVLGASFYARVRLIEFDA